MSGSLQRPVDVDPQVARARDVFNSGASELVEGFQSYGNQPLSAYPLICATAIASHASRACWMAADLDLSPAHTTASTCWLRTWVGYLHTSDLLSLHY